MTNPRAKARRGGSENVDAGQARRSDPTADATPSDAPAQLPGLSRYWTRELVELSAIDPAVIAERGYRTVQWGPNDRHGHDLLAGLGIPSWARAGERGSGLLIPMYRATGERISAQWKPEKQIRNRDGKYVKYASVRGQTNRLDIHPRNRDRIVDPTVPLWVTEGIKKADALISRGACVVALTGVFNWRSRLGTLGDWEDVPLKGRQVVVCFDADAHTNMNVLRAMVRLGRWLKSKGARVLYLIVPGEVNGTKVKGADDYLAAGGTLDELFATATTTEPNTTTTDDTFSDARMAETVADDVLDGEFLWCKGLGWLRWTGQRWEEATDETVGEAVRQYVLDRFNDVLAGMRSAVGQASNTNAIDGWRSMLSLGRQRGVLTLARGIVERRADQFDADPDLLNTPSEMVDLTTGQVLPHDPDALITKITKGCYRPGYVHHDWETALQALPPESRHWYQARVGQGITGHPTPDGIMPVLQGSGENGKSLLTTDGVLPALGDYADVASGKLISATKGVEHSTEMADLRGKRFLIAEEMTEGRALDVTAIKRIQDVGTIKARYVHKDNMTFPASHSLFATTNYVTRVDETDHGTWRRLALLKFPYTFRKPGEPLSAPTDRRGDPELKPRIREGATGQHDAIVTWAVEGAVRVATEGAAALAVPPCVAADTRAWRASADRILGYWIERLVPDPKACVVAAELLQDFNDWLAANEHKKWSRETFAPKFGGHAETTRHGVDHRRMLNPKGLVRRPRSQWEPPPAPVSARVWVWLGVRYRTTADQDESDPLPEVPEVEQTSPVRAEAGKFPETRAPRAPESSEDHYEDPQSHAAASSTPAETVICPRCRYPATRLVPPDGLCPRCAYPAGGWSAADTEEAD